MNLKSFVKRIIFSIGYITISCLVIEFLKNVVFNNDLEFWGYVGWAFAACLTFWEIYGKLWDNTI
jgi:uncharacterized membrane protein